MAILFHDNTGQVTGIEFQKGDEDFSFLVEYQRHGKERERSPRGWVSVDDEVGDLGIPRLLIGDLVFLLKRGPDGEVSEYLREEIGVK